MPERPSFVASICAFLFSLYSSFHPSSTLSFQLSLHFPLFFSLSLLPSFLPSLLASILPSLFLFPSNRPSFLLSFLPVVLDFSFSSLSAILQFLFPFSILTSIIHPFFFQSTPLSIRASFILSPTLPLPILSFTHTIIFPLPPLVRLFIYLSLMSPD